MSEPRRYEGNGVTCGTCGSFRRCCDCGGGWCMELMRPVRGDEEACEEHDPETDGRSRG